MDFARARGGHDPGDVVGAQAAGDQDDDVLPRPGHEAGQGPGPGHRGVSPRGENPVVAQLHEDVESAVLVLHLVETAVEGQGRSPRLVAQARGRVHVDLPVASENTNDEAEAHGRSPTKRRQGHDVGGDTINFVARVDEVPGAWAHEHLDATGGRHLKGGRHLVEGGGQSAARQVPADLDAVRAPVAGPAGAQCVLDADLHDGHGCHLS